MALSSLLLITFAKAVDLGASEGRVSQEVSSLTVDLHEALLEVSADLRNSAFLSDGSYPQLLTPTELSAAGWNTGDPYPSTASAEPNLGVLFVLPADADGDGRPDVTTEGEVEWDAREFGYVIVPDATGSNRVERWVDGAFDKVVCRHAETLTVESNATSPTEVPFGCLQVRIVLGGDAEGRAVSRDRALTFRINQDGGV